MGTLFSFSGLGFNMKVRIYVKIAVAGGGNPALNRVSPKIERAYLSNYDAPLN